MPGRRSNLHQVLAGRKISRTTLGNHGCSSFQAGRAAPSSEPAHNQQEPEETQSSQALGTSQRVHRGRQEANTTIPGWWCSRWEREGSTEFPVVPLFLTWMVGTQESASWQVINLCTYMVPSSGIPELYITGKKWGLKKKKRISVPAPSYTEAVTGLLSFSLTSLKMQDFPP